MIDIAIAGASGRMGREVAKELAQTDGMQLTKALVSSNSQYLNKDLKDVVSDIPSILCTNSLAPDGSDCKVLIDFSTTEASIDYLQTISAISGASDNNQAVVVCTTGFTQEQLDYIERISEKIPLLQASNTSLGVTLLLQLVRHAAKRLQDADIEIIEAHHRNKKDAPSGTAISLGEAAAQAREGDLKDSIYHRHGNSDIRPKGPIGFSSIRGGDIVGDHTVLLAMDEERVELTHKASSRRLFAQGAIKAARWLAQQTPGRVYSMDDVLEGCGI